MIFIIAKVVFMLVDHEGHVFTAADVCDVVRHGLTLDLSTSLYLLIVPFLLSFASLWWDDVRRQRLILNVYYVVIAAGLMLAFVADTGLYPYWGYKLDSSCLQYLETPAEARASVSGLYMAVCLVVIVVGTIVISRIYRLIPLWSKKSSSHKTGTIGNLLLIPVFIIGIRGGIDESTTNVGQVYYSQDQFLNHSAVNPVFSFFDSFEKTVSDVVEYHFMSDEECHSVLSGCYPTESTLTDTLLTTTRPDIVLILMESAGEAFAPAMPRLQQLKREGITFANCYGNSYRTDRGTICALSGYPSFPTMSVMKMAKKAENLPSIARSLQQEGYATSYLYGGDINFTNMKSYMIATGWEKLHWKADYSIEEQNTAKWGVRDDITFKTLYRQIMEADTTRHFLMGFSTLSSHEPWDVPSRHLSDEKMNAFHYLDQCIGDFIDQLKASPRWDNLLIILLPDHAINYRQFDESHPQRNHIPLVWTGGAVRRPRVISTLCNQTDLVATLLAQMQLPHQAFTFSRDVLSPNYTKPFAVHCFNNGFSIVDSTGFTAFDLTSSKTIAGSNSRAVTLGKAILQATSHDLKERK